MSDPQKRNREETWVKKRNHYVRTIVITETVPADEVLTCVYCGNPMFEPREGQLYCSSAHRIAAHRSKQRRNGNGGA